MPMKIVTIKVPQELLEKIDNEIKKEGFHSRGEFFRYLATKYFEEKGKHKIMVVGVHDVELPAKNVPRRV